MPPRFAKHSLTYAEGANNYTFFFFAPPDHYTGIEALTGVTKLIDTSVLSDMPITKTGELCLSPVAVRKTLRVTTTTGKTKYVDIVISSAKAAGIDKELQNKPYKGGTIKRVLDPRKQTKY